jgi:hypothetical protein
MLPQYRTDSAAIPLLMQRVKLAKKVFTQSFVHSQTNKELSWLMASAKETGLEIDETLRDEVGDTEMQAVLDAKSRKALERLKAELRAMVNTPIMGLDKTFPNSESGDKNGKPASAEDTSVEEKQISASAAKRQRAKKAKQQAASSMNSMLNRKQRKGSFVVVAK